MYTALDSGRQKPLKSTTHCDEKEKKKHADHHHTNASAQHTETCLHLVKTPQFVLPAVRRALTARVCPATITGEMQVPGVCRAQQLKVAQQRAAAITPVQHQLHNPAFPLFRLSTRINFQPAKP